MDPNPDGGFRGWADRLAERLAEDEPDLRYANLAIRGKLSRRCAPSNSMTPSRSSPTSPACSPASTTCCARTSTSAAVASEIEAMVVTLRGIGADVITVTFPDPVPVNPLASRAAARVRRLNAMIRELSAEHGAKVVDLEAHPVSSDRRLWDVDRLHANPEGHRRIALAAAEALGLDGADAGWTDGVRRSARARARGSSTRCGRGSTSGPG